MKDDAFTFIEYLNRYCTVSAKHESAFDEYVASAPEPPSGPLRLDTAVERFIMRRFQEERPPSIILTGNAGDGKTYLSRRIITEFTGKSFQGWGASLDQAIPRSGTTLHVVKDLSEVDESQGAAYLAKLAQGLESPSSSDVYLIAANEGRLRRLLLNPAYHDLRAEVDRQLENGPDEASHLVVINLNRIATSLLIPQVLAWLTHECNWPGLSPADENENPIHYNILRLRDPHVQDRVQLLYRLLERLGHHITIRDMLIHLAFSVTGGQSSEALANRPMQERRRFSYYENFVGETADEVFRERSSVLRLLAPLRFGDFSCYELDDFIINGHEDGHPYHEGYEGLFQESIDLGRRFFAQERDAYLHGTASASEAADLFLRTLPSLRRKAFFEWHIGTEKALTNQLILLDRFTEYENLLADAFHHDEAKRLLILGLNRAFSGLYLEADSQLLLTSQYTNKVSITIPIVMATLPAANLELHVSSVGNDILDRHDRQLMLRVYPPPRLQAEVDPIEWPINLLTYEYLVRRAIGGTPDVLADECALEVRMLKDRLTQQIVNRLPPTQRIEFIGPDKNEYCLFQVHIQGEESIMVKRA